MNVMLSDFDREVYQTIAAYAFDLPECWPSQSLIASNIGITSRKRRRKGEMPNTRTVTRVMVAQSVARLVGAGWVRIKERPWSRRTGWKYNVYELLEPWCVSDLVACRIVARAHRRRRREAWVAWVTNARKSGRFAPMNTNVLEVRNVFGNDVRVDVESLRACRCRSCKTMEAEYQVLDQGIPIPRYRELARARRVWPGGIPPKDAKQRKQVAASARQFIWRLEAAFAVPMYNFPDGTCF